MSRRRKLTDTTPFDTLRLEGTLFVPELLERAARGEAAGQKEADYGVPKGLKLHDEYGRAYRIATALWQDFAPQLPRTDIDPAKLTRAFVLDLLRQCLGYTDIALLLEPVQIGDRGFRVTAQALGGHLPVIIATHSLGLDDPDPGFAIHGSGSKKKSAHQLAQEFLNADRNSLWAIVTNGRTLRLLRDADTLTRPNFLEFDLETILREGEDRYADFSALWRMLHASRAGKATAPAADCIWEKWKSEGHEQGNRVRKGLSAQVTEALKTLGRGFLTHRDNDALRQRLHDGTLTTDAYFQQLLRLIYRYLFLFCAEERDLLHPPLPEDEKEAATARAARQSYSTGYALRRLRNRALRHAAHDSHGDLWLSLRITFRALSAGQPRLALPSLGGLFAETQCPDLDSAALANRDLLAAMRHLRWSTASGSLTAIDYRNMGPEELGSVYESLLELVPQLNLPARTFGFAGITDSASTSGNARKTTGSYYTPDSLVQELIKSALDPVIADRLTAQPDRPIDALLSITVCDPSCGSGHFLLAAARRLAEKLAELRAPDGAVRPDDYRHALREVASRCLYGVDINPMAVELCRVALWLETVDPGKPLGFLNHHIRTGNSLLGTTPDLIAAGLPDDTFTAIEGDDKAACAELKKRNKKEREGFGPLFEQEEQTIRDRLRHAATQIEAMDDSQPAALHQKEAAFTTSETAPEYRHAKLLADLWCAAFVIKKHYPATAGEAQSAPSPHSHLPSPIEGHLLHTEDDLFGQATAAPTPKAAKTKQPRTQNQEPGTAEGITTANLRDFVQGKILPADLHAKVEDLAGQYRFFHWHLAFPQVFDQGGFACILGNPPWDRVKFNEQDWFAERMPEIANAPTTAARKKLVEGLAFGAPSLSRDFEFARREFEGLNSIIRASGIFPKGSSGELNLATLFAERTTNIVGPHGQVGLVLPTTIVTDKSAQPLCRSWIEHGRLVAVYDFENRNGLFPEVHRSYKFAILTLRGSSQPGANVRTAFYLQDPAELSLPENVMSISVADIAEVNPNTLSFPVSRTAADAGLLLIFHRRSEPLLRDSDAASGGSWGYSVFFVFEMNKDSSKFITSPKPSSLPLLEAKLIHQFEHRAATFEGQSSRDITNGNARESTNAELADPSFIVKPRYWIPSSDVADSFKRGGLATDWAVVAREITNATNERTVITCIIPKVGMGHTCWTLRLLKADAALAGIFSASLNSFAHDYAARQKVSGTHLSNFIIKQLPVLPQATYARPCPWANRPQPATLNTQSLREWLLPRVLELTYTAWDLEAFASDCGWSGPPFRWDEERRFLLQSELDAAFFHLYLGPQTEWQQQPEALTRAFPTPRHAVSYIMDTFPIVKRKDEAKHGHYRTKETILQIYDALGEAIQSGQPYQTLLNPPPADPACCHPPKGSATTPEGCSKPNLQITHMSPPPSSPSNPFFLLPEQGLVNLGKKPGGGVYYARVSQTQTDVPRENGPRAFWRLEGFSQAWFDANLPPADEPTWRDPVEFSRYYSEAPIFLLELEVIPAHLNRFAPFGLINEFAEREAEPKEWFRVTAGGPRNGRPIQDIVPMTVFPSLYQEGIALTLDDIETVDEETQEQLDKAVSTGHIADAEDAEITRILGAFGSSIDWSIVYDVGQGNSIGFCDSAGFVRGYFDIGGGVGPNLSTFPPALTGFCFTQSPPIILSHWDEDHWSSANHARGLGALSKEWIVPRQTLTPAHVALLAAIASAGGKAWFLPSTFVGKWFGQIYLELCTGPGRNHSGIALTLSEQPNGAGQHILMPGDADYRYIPSVTGGQQYLSVVAPHHGAKLHGTTLPSCPGAAASRLVYSAGPRNTYRHPHHATRVDHDAVGWHDPSVSIGAPIKVRETSNRSAADLGHVLLSWVPHSSVPSVPCGAIHCQLQAQSHQL